MMRFVLLTGLAMALSACAAEEAVKSGGVSDDKTQVEATERVDTLEAPAVPSSLGLEDIDFTSYSRELARFTGLEEGQSRAEAVDNIRLYFAPENGDTIIKTTQSKFEREDGAVLLFGASGLPDDSVKAEEIFLILTGPKGKQTLGAFGSKIMCHRGSNTTEWQTEPCP